MTTVATRLVVDDSYSRPDYAAALCPQCGKFSSANVKFCDQCGHGLCNPLVIATDLLDHVSFGTLFTFALKLLLAFCLAAIPFALVIGLLVAILSH